MIDECLFADITIDDLNLSTLQTINSLQDITYSLEQNKYDEMKLMGQYDAYTLFKFGFVFHFVIFSNCNFKKNKMGNFLQFLGKDEIFR